MSDATIARREIRNGTLEAANTLREEVRGNERVLESIEHLIKPLTARQETAINLLSMGKSVVATAKSLDIGESTLHRWKSCHPLFRAELARRQANLFDAMVNKLRLTMGKAIDELYSMITSDSSYQRREVMKEVLKFIKPERLIRPPESTTASAVLDDRVRETRASRGETVNTEITDEERIAAIPIEYRQEMEEDSANRPANHASRDAECSDVAGGARGMRSGTPSAGEIPPVTRNATRDGGQILRCAQDDDSREDCHAERSEASGSERELRSGAASAGEIPPATLDATRDGGQILRCAQDDDSSEDCHAERSEASGSERELRSGAASASEIPPATRDATRDGGQILRCAQDDGACATDEAASTRHAERSEASSVDDSARSRQRPIADITGGKASHASGG